MTYIENLVYETPLERLETPEDVLALLQDVREDLVDLNMGTHVPNFHETLGIIRQGMKDSKPQIKKVIRIDLSRAQKLVQDYETRTNVSCDVCTNRGLNKPTPDGGGYFCKLRETPADAEEQHSPLYEQYRKGDCPYVKSLPPIEDILKTARKN